MVMKRETFQTLLKLYIISPIHRRHFGLPSSLACVRWNGLQVGRTRVMRQSSSPVWDESFQVRSHPPPPKQTLVFRRLQMLTFTHSDVFSVCRLATSCCLLALSRLRRILCEGMIVSNIHLRSPPLLPPAARYHPH